MRKLELTPFEHNHLCVALEAHIDSLKTYCIDLKKRESPDQWDESSMQKEIKQVEALYERCMNLDKKQYSVSLNLETAITTSVIANNEEEAKQIAIDNFYENNIKEVQEMAESEFLVDFLYGAMSLSEHTLPVVEEEDA